MGKNKASKKRKNSINWIPFFCLITIGLFALILWDPIHFSLSGNQQSPSESINGTMLPRPTLTPLPDHYPDLPREFFENENETIGVISGGTILVLIILIGTLVSLRSERKRNEK